MQAPYNDQRRSSASSLFFMLLPGTFCNVGSSLLPDIDVLLCRRGRCHSLQPECLSRSYVGLVQSVVDRKSRGLKTITLVFVPVFVDPFH